jgi:hypothetical protein
VQRYESRTIYKLSCNRLAYTVESCVTFARQKSNPVLGLPSKPKRKKKNAWPNVYTRTHRSGSKSWVVDLGEIDRDGKRDRHSFKTEEEADTFSEQARIKRQNEGFAAFSLPSEIRADALRASESWSLTGFLFIRPHSNSSKLAMFSVPATFRFRRSHRNTPKLKRCSDPTESLWVKSFSITTAMSSSIATFQ